MPDLNHLAMDVIRDGVAVKIAESLTGPEKDSIIAKAVTDLMGNYVVKDMIQKKLLARVDQLAGQMIEEGRYDQKITEAIGQGLAAAMDRIRQAAELALPQAVCGPVKDNYGQGSLVAAMYAQLLKNGK